jgi:hypothetical protein
MSKINFFSKTKGFQRITAAIVILLVAAIGAYLIVGSHAATPYASISADNGTLASGAIKQACTGASDGNCVVFGSQPSGGGGGGSTQTDCITLNGTNPPNTSCGYPSPTNTGVSNCAALPNLNTNNLPAGTYYSGSGSTLEITANNVTISNLNLGDFNIYISGANNFTLDNSCMDVNGGADEGSMAIIVPAGVTGTTIENSTLTGTNDTSGTLGAIVDNNGSGTIIKNNFMDNAGGGAPGAGGGDATVTGNYELVNGNASGPTGVEHYEPIYCSDDTVTLTHNTLIDVHDQTSDIFCNTGGGAGGACDNHLVATDNLLAGSGYMTYPCANSSSAGSGTVEFENNRLARCLSSSCPDTHGYYPGGGYYGVEGDDNNYCSNPKWTWSGNVWDDNNAPISCS